MELTITKEPKENRQLAVTIEVDQAHVDQELKKAARKLAGKYRIPGFRKGKAPYQILVQYLGLPALYKEFVDDLGQEAYKRALEQESIEPYAQASLDDISFDPLQFKLTVPIDPEIDLGDYRSIRVEEEEISIAEEDVEAELQRYQEQYATWRTADRPSDYGDLMTINVRSVIVDEKGDPFLDAESGAETVVLEEEDWDVTPDKDNAMEPPGFDEALIGLTPGTEKAVILGWPEDSQSIYAGKRAQFTIKVTDVQAYENAELNDELAKLVGPDFETLEDLKNHIRQTLEEQNKQQADAEYLDAALTALVEQSKLNYPPVVIEDQIDAMMNEFAQQLRRFGIDNLEEYLHNAGQSVDEFRASQRDEAIRIAERNLVISELLNVEKLQVSDDEVEAHIDEMIGNATGEEAEALRALFHNDSGRAIFQSQLLQEKAIERLLAIVRGEEIPDPEDEAAVESVTSDDDNGDASDGELDADSASPVNVEVAPDAIVAEATKDEAS